ncbi:AAC(3) family N-acetyltransferase [Ectothiorhodospira shaposhnikovii]|uniref:AAC(3) family N-acetyltransferase n=1 Tax=Ectothiorhodospira shaposhnikovii TaxID=1054 RepID=UPI00399F2222
MVHASWRPGNGFLGRPSDMVTTLKDLVGHQGLLIMPSLTYQNESSREFLARGVPMDVRRSPSQMGLLSEVFRRGKGVRRSLSPTHPLLAWGHRAEEFLVGHDEALVPFGPQSPFGRLLEWNGKILTIDAPFSTVTFTHFLEDRIAQTLPVPLYEPEPMEGTVIDYEGVARKVPVKVLSATANRLRRDDLLEAELLKEGVLKRRRVGNTRLGLLDCRAMTEVVDHLVASGRHFFDSPQ